MQRAVLGHLRASSWGRCMAHSIRNRLYLLIQSFLLPLLWAWNLIHFVARSILVKTTSDCLESALQLQIPIGILFSYFYAVYSWISIEIGLHGFDSVSDCFNRWKPLLEYALLDADIPS